MSRLSPELWADRVVIPIDVAVRLVAEALAGSDHDPDLAAIRVLRMELEAFHKEWVKEHLSSPEQAALVETGNLVQLAILPQAFSEWIDGKGYRSKLPSMFPKDREPEKGGGQTMRADTREGFLLLIGLLTHALSERGGNTLKNDNGPNRSGIITEIQKTAARLQVPLEGLADSTLHDKLRDALSLVKDRKTRNPQ